MASQVPSLDAEAFAAYVRACRNVLGWSQTELGERVGLTQKSIFRIEGADVDVRLSNANEIVKVFAKQGMEWEASARGGFSIRVTRKALQRRT